MSAITTTKERAILMCGEMVRATLRDKNPKTQTRRTMKQQPSTDGFTFDHDRWLNALGEDFVCPYGNSGDQLWVKETHAVWSKSDIERKDPASIVYRVESKNMPLTGQRWRPSIFMPRWASRITLEIESVRVERLQDISDEDAKAEGIGRHTKRGVEWFDIYPKPDDYPGATNDPRLSYRTLWESINGTGSWDNNPWVWVITFKRV